MIKELFASDLFLFYEIEVDDLQPNSIKSYITHFKTSLRAAEKLVAKCVGMPWQDHFANVSLNYIHCNRVSVDSRRKVAQREASAQTTKKLNDGGSSLPTVGDYAKILDATKTASTSGGFVMYVIKSTCKTVSLRVYAFLGFAIICF